MAKYDINLRPIHYASVSGGKDSLYMLGLILANPDKYPLDCVVHFELEIDWDWAKKVVDEMEQRCKKIGIPFYRIKPRQTWDELFKQYGFPNSKFKWCNYKYKLDAKKQLNDWVASQNCRPIAYIGLCADEQKRFKYEIGDGWELGDVCYPLAEEGINEDLILGWAKNQPIFGNWYQYFRRQGCMMCPFIQRKQLAYMLKYYPASYNKFIDCLRKTETKILQKEKDENKDYNSKFALWDYADNIDKLIRTKWLSILEMEENQQTLFDNIFEV